MKNRHIVFPLPLALTLVIGLAFSSTSRAAEPDLLSLSLEDILNVQITSVSRKSQRLTDSAAAAFVLTNEDIRRSGATSIPEALRMVPGLDVARLGSNRWAVSSRGFNGRFANKLLVQVDGRSIYSKLFSGVFWEAEDLMLEDVERIEVIRGPGAALWGSNAVNGVINIITRKAKATQGSLLTAHAGSVERGGASVRHGGQVDEDTYYRVWGKTFVSGPSVDADGRRTNDVGHSTRGGFRLDKDTGSGGSFSLIGNAYDFSSGEQLLQPNPLAAPYVTPVDLEQKNTGVNLLGRREWNLADGSQAQLQAYIDHSSLRANAVINESRTTVDLDFQYRLPISSRQDLIWGLGYRWAEDSIDTNWVLLNTSPKEQTTQLASAFVHDEITLQPDRWKLMLGAKLEHNSYTGAEIQPNARITWTPSPHDTLWAAVSRGVRTPSRAERDSTVDYFVIPPFTSQNPGPLPVLSRVYSNRDLVSEKLLAYEVGYRTQLSSRLSVDTALFYNRYKDLRSAASLGTSFAFFPAYLVSESMTDNQMTAKTYGAEISADWHALDWWRLQAAYTYLNIKADRNGDAANDVPAATLEGSNPEYQLSLRSSMNIGRNQQFDVWLRHVSKLPAIDIPAYTTVDLRYAWRVRKGLELSLVGQNLFDPHHPEFVSDNMPTRNVEIPRGVYAKAVWQF